MRPDDPHTLLRTLQTSFLEQTEEYAFIYMDTDGRIVGWKGAAESILGYREEEMLGAPGQLLFTPDDRALRLDRHELDVAIADSRAEDDRWHVRKDGARIWIHGAVQAIRGPDGALLGFVKVLRDRTDARAQLERAEQELAQSARRWEEGRRMLRTLGHEMRNPLGPLANCAHILERSSSEPAVLKAAGIIRSQVTALTRLAEDLLDVVRTERRTLTRERTRVDLRELLDGQVAAALPTAVERGVELRLLAPEGALWCEVDRDRLGQVVQNLVGNAIKYTGRGGHVWCKLTREANEVVLRVQDTGIGIPADELPRIFELFTRGAQAAQLEPGGLGVGLAVAQEVLREHGGSIQARSAGPGKGSEFALRLPALEPDPGLAGA